MEDSRSLLSGLPKDALTHAVSFLSTKDALELSNLNSSFRRALPFSLLQDPKPLVKEKTWYGGTRDEERNNPRRSVWIPALFPHLTHSIVLDCEWGDHGLVNRKGTLFVVAVPANEDPNEEALESIDNGTIVYESPQAPDDDESLQVSIAYSPENAYYLWYRVGGHHLCIKNLSMRAVIYDDAKKWIGQNYETLRNSGFLENHDAFSLDMFSVLTSMGQEEDGTVATTSSIAGFLERNGLDMSAASLKALAQVATALQEQERMKVAHVALPPHGPVLTGPHIVVTAVTGTVQGALRGMGMVAGAGQMIQLMANQQILNAAADEIDDDEEVDNAVDEERGDEEEP